VNFSVDPRRSWSLAHGGSGRLPHQINYITDIDANYDDTVSVINSGRLKFHGPVAVIQAV